MDSQGPTIEFAEISMGRLASPPAPPAGTNMRAWFAGLALGNPELMKNVPAERLTQEALRLADELMAALTPRVPTEKSLDAPTEAEMQVWDKRINEQARETVKPQKHFWTHAPRSSRPAPPSKPAPGTGTYSVITE